jgi:hypothetical protein
MSTALTKLDEVIVKGDLSSLSSGEKSFYYKQVCESIGLNPLTKPFEYIRLNGKEVLYATRGASEQLRQVHAISIQIASRETIGDIYIVTARASRPDGRCDESTGAVNIKGTGGDNLANAYMKAETKAKRRVTLSICGLGMLDESEVETIPGAKRVPVEEIPVAPMKQEVSPSQEVEKPSYNQRVFTKLSGLGVNVMSIFDEFQRYTPDEFTKEEIEILIARGKKLSVSKATLQQDQLAESI